MQKYRINNKKILSMILSIVLILSMFPSFALAKEKDIDSFEYKFAGDKDIYTFTENQTGYWTSGYAGDNGEWILDNNIIWFYYTLDNPEEGDKLIITYNDNTKETFTCKEDGSFENEKGEIHSYKISFEVEQSYDNQLKVFNKYPLTIKFRDIASENETFAEIVPDSKVVIADGIEYRLNEEQNAVSVNYAHPEMIGSSVKILSAITYPDGNTYPVQSIDKYAFLDCNNLTEVTIPESITKIDEKAFLNTGIEEITIPATVTEIGEYAVGYYRTIRNDNYEYLSVKNFKIDTTPGSEAEKYAQSNRISTIDKAALKAAEQKALADKRAAEEKIKADAYAASKAAVEKLINDYNSASILAKSLKIDDFKVKAKKGKKAVLTWKENEKATGYEIQYSTKKKFKNSSKINIIKSSVKTYKIENLKKKKKYFFRVRTYTQITNPTTSKTDTFYGKWSDVKKITTKK